MSDVIQSTEQRKASSTAVYTRHWDTPTLQIQKRKGGGGGNGEKIKASLSELSLVLPSYSNSSSNICDRLQENQAQRGVRKYREKIDRFLKNVLFQADGRERLGLL